MIPGVLSLAALLAAPAPSPAASRVAKRVLQPGMGAQERLRNGSFEAVEAWGFWDRGYERVEGTARTGAASVTCSSDDPNGQAGASQAVVLNQTEPAPLIAEGWSRAEGVSGSPSGGYAVYVDVAFADGDHLWAQVAPFDTGTHDWQRRRVTLVPEKPVAEMTVYGLFRGHTGRVWFDDFSLTEGVLEAGAGLFDGVPVASAEEPLGRGEFQRLEAGGLEFRVDRRTGGVSLGGEPVGGFLVRDVAAESDFLQPAEATVTRRDDAVTIEARCPELGLALAADLRPASGALRVNGEVRDLRGQDRAVAVYFVLPADFVGGEFGRDMRTKQRVEPPLTYSNTATIGVGTNGRTSLYPLLPVSRSAASLCLATPLDVPRVSRLAYDARSREAYVAFDLGLSADTRKFPSAASFSFLVYRHDPTWGFRAALKQYYDLFPEFFVKRIRREGIWMPFTDIATIPDAADFGFAFKEGDDNVPWDEAHGIDTFVYVEPMSHWIPLAPETPRTYDAALTELKRRAEAEPQCQATLSSAYTNPDGSYHLWVVDAPWCDGGLVTGNPDADLFADRPELPSQAAYKLADIERAFARAGVTAGSAWRPCGSGGEMAADAVRSGGRSARCDNAPGEQHGFSQLIVLNQTEPRELVASAWSRAEAVTGEPDNSYALYVDLVYADGTPSFGHVAAFPVGTHDWVEGRVAIRPEKPVQALTLHVLLRNQHGGTVWFDDVSLTQAGSETNLAADDGFEPPSAPLAPAALDGTYIDSYEMAGTEQNYRREHWAYTDLPLTFSQTTREVCSLGVFHTYEFQRELAARMHARGKLMFANAVLLNFGFPAHLLDVLGVENNWAPAGDYAPNPDSAMNYRRALCYQKPYLLLQNTDYNTFRPEWVERYFKRCAFYAIFPSFFSHNAADDPYWRNPTLYNRDRPLFRRYIPVIAALNAAGWEPITYARMTGGEGKVYVERFGADPQAGVYVTLFNDSDTERAYRVDVDAAALGLGAGRTEATDVLADQPVPLTRAQNALSLEGTLQAEDVRIVKLTQP